MSSTKVSHDKIGATRDMELPEGWVALTLADATLHSSEKAEPKEFGNRKYIGLKNIESGSNRIVSFGDIASVKSTKAVFRKGDVLYGKLRPYLKKVCRPDFDGVCSTDILVFPQVEQLDNGYLLYFLSQNTTADYATQNANGINLPRISPKTLGEIGFSLPPIDEQKRIVTAIESLQERTSRTRALLAEVKPLIAQLRQSVLRSAFSGRLTADWRAKQNTPFVTNHTATEQAAASAGGAGAGSSSVGSTSTSSTGKNTVAAGTQTQQPEADTKGSPQSTDTKFETAPELLQRIRTERRQKWETAQLAAFEAKGKKPTKGWQDKYKEPEPVDDSDLPELPEGWCWARVTDLAEVRLGRQRSPKRATGPNMRKYVRAANVTWNGMDTSDVKEMDFDSDEFEIYRLQDGDILLNEGSGSAKEVGKPAIWRDEIPDCCFQNTLIRVRTVPELVQFLFLHFRYDALSGAFAPETQGINIHHIGRQRLADWRIAVPPLDEQMEIVFRLNLSLGNVQEQKELNAKIYSSLTQLDQSILSKAFKGELVPQDPNDEPASELLARIRATREADLASKKSSKKKAASKKKKPSKKKAASKKKKTSSKKSDS